MLSLETVPAAPTRTPFPQARMHALQPPAAAITAVTVTPLLGHCNIDCTCDRAQSKASVRLYQGAVDGAMQSI